MKKVLLYSLLFLSCLNVVAADYLFRNGKSDYRIVLPSGTSTPETTAARELQKYIKQISNVELPITNTTEGASRFIFIGNNIGGNNNTVKESFTYATANNNLYIWGEGERGSMYGVFSFLENELGVRWYTTDCIKIPTRKKYRLKTLSHTESPSISQRFNFYHNAMADDVWCAHNKLNEQYTPHKNNYGNTTACYGIHTSFKLVPPEQYFKTHPEYYSLRNGQRMHKNGQLCLSNPEVVKIATESLLRIIRNNPGYWTYDVSQCDNQNYCQCDKCTEIANRYGGQSGLMIWFVNQVADEVYNVFPDKTISTFAYQYTRHAPTGIKPRQNVVIRMCNIECCFAHPLETGFCPKNIEFMSDLRNWKGICNRIYIWDYVVNFYNYLVPFPNFGVLKDNVRTFATNNVIGVLEEGAHNAQWAEFSELRQWILARLLWNPEQDVNALIKEFIGYYYGSASSQILKYFKLTQNFASGSHLIYNTHYEHACYDDRFTSQALPILEKASAKVKNDTVLTKRVNRVLAQVYYLYSCRHREAAKVDGTYQKLQNILEADPTRVSEGNNSLDEHTAKQGFM